MVLIEFHVFFYGNVGSGAAHTGIPSMLRNETFFSHVFFLLSASV